ncbi:MAG TPA: tetratricopeptide repeat protein, partial [Ktedonobacteraceae bacterium]|nr:tetratricopeptide repeat protein [Ktedonobacteraceae bacterium]
LNLQAMAQAAMRNYAQAVMAHQRCINLLESVEPYDPFFAIQVYMYMGQHYTHLNNFAQAQETFQKALAIAEKLTTPSDIQAAYWNLCQHYASIKETELATLYAYKSFHLHDLREWKYLRSEIYYYLGRAMLKGDPEKARSYLDKAQQEDGAIKDPLSCATILAREAEWHFGQGNFALAQQYAQQACDLAQPFGDTIIRADALIIRGRIEYAQQEYEQGSHHFAAGLEMLERLDKHEELADESVRYAQQLEDIGKPHEAFTYFRKAFQSKQKIGK